MTKKWRVEFKPSAFRELAKLPSRHQSQIFHFLDKLLQDYSSPRAVGLPLKGNYNHLWRYRVGNYRLICEVQDIKLTILVLGIGYRKDVYLKH